MSGLIIKNADILNLLINESFKNGVLVLKAGRNTLRFLPPLTITKEEIDKGFERLKKVFKEVLR